MVIPYYGGFCATEWSNRNSTGTERDEELKYYIIKTVNGMGLETKIQE
jgi:hypothetical protein